MTGSKRWSTFMPSKLSTRVPVGSSSNRAWRAACCSRLHLWPIALAAIVASATLLATARADDVLDRAVQFHISPSPLASALIEFSTQSGLQVAVADADVARLRSGGMTGTSPIGSALSELLRGTGLEFARVGTETVAIRAAPGGAVAGTFVGGAGTGPVPPVGPSATEPSVGSGGATCPTEHHHRDSERADGAGTRRRRPLSVHRSPRHGALREHRRPRQPRALARRPVRDDLSRRRSG